MPVFILCRIQIHTQDSCLWKTLLYQILYLLRSHAESTNIR